MLSRRATFTPSHCSGARALSAQSGEIVHIHCDDQEDAAVSRLLENADLVSASEEEVWGELDGQNVRGLAYALLGFCEGKLGHAAAPPKVQTLAYMNEFIQGQNQAQKGQKRVKECR